MEGTTARLHDGVEEEWVSARGHRSGVKKASYSFTENKEREKLGESGMALEDSQLSFNFLFFISLS